MTYKITFVDSGLQAYCAAIVGAVIEVDINQGITLRLFTEITYTGNY
ncbi:MAG: hypothetical protein WBP88_03750 [Nitrososphaeraceae archaeon]